MSSCQSPRQKIHRAWIWVFPGALRPGNSKLRDQSSLKDNLQTPLTLHYFANKGLSGQGYGFSTGHVWMWELNVKKVECRKIDTFELWCWRRLLRVPWTARRSNQSILKEISPGCSLEGLKLKLKLQYFGHLMQSWLIGKDPDAGRDWGQEEKGTTEDEIARWHHWLDGHEFA